MSGASELAISANNHLKEKKDQISQFEDEINLDQIAVSAQEIQSMTAIQCIEKAADIASYGIYLQRILNKERAYLRWLEAKINLAIANELNSYEGFYNAEQRRSVAIVNNQYAQQLEKLRMNVSCKVDVLESLPYEINMLCKILSEAQANKQNRG